MAFGVKIKTLKTSKAYTIESLHEAIKDHEFAAGKPELTKNGLAWIITFPPVDDQNQVWIMNAGFKAESQKFSIQKQEKAGVGNMLKNSVIDDLTGGIFGFGKMVGGNAKKAEQQVEEIFAELEKMGL